MNALAPDWDALARFIAEESDPAEVRTVEAWLATHPVDAALLGTVKTHGDIAAASVATPVHVDAAWNAVRTRMAEATGRSANNPAPQAEGLSVIRGDAPRGGVSTSQRDGRQSRTRSRWGRLAFAAAAMLVVFAGVRAWQRGDAAVERGRVLATNVGQRDSLTLDDGTRIVLAPGSRLAVAVGFADGDRSVELEGAAYFDVQHDKEHPFTVHAAGAEIRDIGTRFTVKTDGIGGVSVSVTHGIVAVRELASSTPTAVELHAGDRGIVSVGNVAVSRGAVTDDELAWTRGQLNYRDAPLSEVQADLRRWYGINLVVADSALSRLTVTMQVQQDQARVISTIAAVLGADVEQRGDTVILRSAGRGTIP